MQRTNFRTRRGTFLKDRFATLMGLPDLSDDVLGDWDCTRARRSRPVGRFDREELDECIRNARLQSVV